MKKILFLLVAAFALLAVASCDSFFDDSVKSLRFAELPEATVLNTQDNTLTATVVVVRDSGDETYSVTVSKEGLVATQDGASIADHGFEVSGNAALAAGAEVGNYVLTLTNGGVTLIHNYRVISEPSQRYFASGEGTAEKPFIIETAQQLFNMRYATFGADLHFKLDADINLSNFKWIAVGSLEKPFQGTLDGNGHRIIGLSNELTDSYTAGSTTSSGIFGDNFGLFGAASGQTTVKDLTFVDVAIDGANLKGAAAVIGIWTPRATGDTVTLQNITVSGSIKGKDKIAGMIGTGDNADRACLNIIAYENFINCTNNATIVAELNQADNNRAAGMIAQIRDTNSEAKGQIYVRFENCVNNGSITCNSQKGAEAAGLVASLNTTPSGSTLMHATVINCANNGALNANNHAGGEYQLYKGYKAE